MCMKENQNDIDRKLRLSKKFFCFGLVTFCIGFLMLGFAIGRLSSSSSNVEADGCQTDVTVEGNVYVSDSPGSSGTTRTVIAQLLREVQAR